MPTELSVALLFVLGTALGLALLWLLVFIDKLAHMPREALRTALRPYEQKRYALILGDHIIVSPDKGAVGTARDFLIDDHPEWANAHNFSGTPIHFKNNWSEVCAQLLAAPRRAA
jgi:hypothetical protein